MTYTEDVNDNAEFYAKVRTQLEQGQDIGRDIVVLNAAAALVVAGQADSLEEGLAVACESIDSGKARAALAGLVAATNTETASA